MFLRGGPAQSSYSANRTLSYSATFRAYNLYTSNSVHWRENILICFRFPILVIDLKILNCDTNALDKMYYAPNKWFLFGEMKYGKAGKKFFFLLLSSGVFAFGCHWHSPGGWVLGVSTNLFAHKCWRNSLKRATLPPKWHFKWLSFRSGEMADTANMNRWVAKL